MIFTNSKQSAKLILQDSYVGILSQTWLLEYSSDIVRYDLGFLNHRIFKCECV